MPAVRDFAANYTTATNTALICSAPSLQTNDLLLSMATCDTGAAGSKWCMGEDFTKVWQYTNSGAVYTAYETNANGGTNWYMTGATAAASDACYFGHNSMFNGVTVTCATAPSMSMTWVWEYWNGSSWATLTTLANTITTTMTAGGKCIVFNPPTNWATTSVNGVTCYWIRMRVSAYTSQTTRPIFTFGGVSFWNQLFSNTSGTTSHNSIMWKVAGGSEPAQYLAHEAATTSDTKNVTIISVRDVDTDTPMAHQTVAALNNPESTQDSDLALNNTTTAAGQSFAGPATAYRIATAKFYLKKVGSPTGNAVAKLYAHSGSFGSTSVPTGIPLAISNTFDVSTLTGSYQLVEFKFPHMFQYWMTASTNYVIVIEYTNGDANNYIHVGYDNSAPAHAGNASTYAGAWTAQSYDLCFYVYYFNFGTTSSSSGRYALPTMDTLRNDSLLLYSVATAAVSVPSIVEGPVTLLTARDGSSHSDGTAWGFQAVAGTTPSTVYCSALGTSFTQTGSVCAVNPPSGGAGVIPGYCVSDASVYISPMTGAAFLSDSAANTTVTSSFGATLNGVTLAVAGATTVTYADTGINSYHAMMAIIGGTTASVFRGMRCTIASRNLAAKNVLFHIQPYIPVNIQTTDSVALSGACGVGIGMASVDNTDYKVWHVGGANSSWGVSRHQPVVINTDYDGAGLIQNTGTLNPAAVVTIGFMVSGRVVAPTWLLGSVWVLDTTVVAGGNSTEPLDIPGIVRAAADGHERRSVLAQGSSQFLCLQPLQIGDGGTNPVYLDLNATALEFPKQYDKSSKNVAYCSIDNVCGLKYYPGAGDTIKHRNSVITSASKYFWGLHASASESATYDFSGLAIIGAGTITLARAITIGEITINGYGTLDISGLTLNDSDILNVPASNDLVTVTAGTMLNRCNIDVRGITAGNRWCSTTTPSIFANCTFIGSGTTGHAIRITTPGTYNLVGNTFTGFGADGTNYAAIFNDSGGAVTLNVSGGVASPTVRNGAGASTTINNYVNFKLTGLDTDTSVSIVRVSDGVELFWGTAVAGEVTYQYNYTSDTAVFVQILDLNKAVQIIEGVTLGNTSQTIPVTQSDDAVYSA